MICEKCNYEIIDGCCQCTCAGCERLEQQLDHMEATLAKRVEAHIYLCVEHEELKAELEQWSEDFETLKSTYESCNRARKAAEKETQRLRDALEEIADIRNNFIKGIDSAIVIAEQALKGGVE